MRGSPQCLKSRYGYALAECEKLCTRETGGESGTRVKSTIRHPKFGVRGSKFRKPLALEEVGAEAGSILLADHE